jgi:excisionase family DNA binding protein
MNFFKDRGEEPFYTIKEAAGRLNLPYWKLQRAVKQGAIPSYTVLNSRRLVRLSEIVAHISGADSRRVAR